MTTFPRSHETYASFPLPLMQPAVNETIRNLQCPHRLAQSAALSVACLAVQSLVDVRLPRGHVVPVSLFNWVVANSGEGKTAAEGVLKRGVTKFEDEAREKHAAEMKEYREKMELFKVTRQALATGIRRAISDGGDVDEAEEALKHHLRSEPEKPKLVRFCYEDVTPEAWLAAISDNFPSSALFSSEGAGILNGRSFSDLEKLNQAWSGGGLSADRKSQGSIYVAWCRVMQSLMLQPGPLVRFLESNKGQKAKELGFLARVLVFDTGSTQGTRTVHDNTNSWQNSDLFGDRVYELLCKAAEVVGKVGYTPEVMEFSPEASAYWFELHNWIEKNILPGGRYEHAADHASKLSENMARVAAVLHYFEGYEGKISKETLEIALVICEDASMDYLKIFVPPPREHQDAKMLYEWLMQFRQKGTTNVPKNFARRNCPNPLRKDGRFYMAVATLRQSGYISEFLDSKHAAHIELSGIHGVSGLKWTDATPMLVQF